MSGVCPAWFFQMKDAISNSGKREDSIIQLIRQLNAAAVARDQDEDLEDRFQATLDEMH